MRLGKAAGCVREKNSPWKLTPAGSPLHSSRRTSMASSARRARMVKSTPTATASPRSTARPTVRRLIRPRDSSSSVASLLGGDDRMVARQHHRRAEQQRASRRRDVRQEFQRDYVAGQRRTRVHRDVFGRVKGLEAALLGVPPRRGHQIGIGRRSTPRCMPARTSSHPAFLTGTDGAKVHPRRDAQATGGTTILPTRMATSPTDGGRPPGTEGPERGTAPVLAATVNADAEEGHLRRLKVPGGAVCTSRAIAGQVSRVGFSKDRHSARQITIGRLTGQDGSSLMVSALDGNKTETKTRLPDLPIFG
jgi:hypothetical protein